MCRQWHDGRGSHGVLDLRQRVAVPFSRTMSISAPFTKQTSVSVPSNCAQP